MPNDVIVVVNIDARPTGTENLDILLLSTEGEKAIDTYRDLEVIQTTFTGKRSRQWLRSCSTRGTLPWPIPLSER